jgi:LuxR family maltose regulon positive regulatory protein
MLALTAQAYACINSMKLHRAHDLCIDALEAAEACQRAQGQMLPASAIAYAFLARIWLEWGETGKATQTVRKGLALAELWGQVDTVMMCLLYLAYALSLDGDSAGVAQTIQRARQTAEKVSPWFMWNVEQVEFTLFLDSPTLEPGEISREARRRQEAGMKFPVTEEARLLLKQNLPDEALALLEPALRRELSHPSADIVRIFMIQSLAFYQKKDEARAFSALKKALALAEPENLVASFVREGPVMEKLLRLAQAKSSHREFVRRLLAAFEKRRKPGPPAAVEALIEPLSERELEVLQLLNGPLSTPEIAGQLIVSANTVRTHIKNIYGKLSAHGRSGAVRRAKELGLLN